MWLLTAAGEEKAVEMAAEQLSIDGQDCMMLVGRDITAELAAEERLVIQAYHDPLTGLPNRKLCEERWEHAVSCSRQDGSSTAVFFIDLDHMKWVNDTHGHRAGDELLVTAARRLRQALRPGDLLARFGGDELVAVAHVSDESEAQEIGERLCTRMAQPMELAGTPLRVTASVGIALAEPKLNIPLADLLRFADVAMYRAKRAGGNGVALFDPYRRRRADPRPGDAGGARPGPRPRRARAALPADRLAARPVGVGGRGAAALGAPAARPDPAVALPPAGRGQRTDPPDRRLGRRAGLPPARRLASPRPGGGRLRGDGQRVGHQLAADGFVDHVAAALRAAGLPAGCLEIELTERVALGANDAALALSRLGVRLAIDDFGQGYGFVALPAPAAGGNAEDGAQLHPRPDE